MNARSKRLLLAGLVCLGLLCPFVLTSIDPGVRSAEEPRDKFTDVRLLYSSGGYDEVPFFLPDSVSFETGDNKNDRLAVISMVYGMDPDFISLPDLRHLENPRPDVGGERRIVFSAVGADGRKGIYMFDGYSTYDLRRNKAVPLWTDAHNNWHPCLNSQCNLLAFVSDAPGSPQIFLLDLNTKKTKQLTTLKRALSPALDAAGEWVYFAGTDRENNQDIYKVRTDGRELTRLTDSPEIEKYPTLTKYGKWIAYERGTGSKRGIWLMTLDGRNQRRVSAPSYWAASPCLNVDGTMALFEGRVNGKSGIYLADVPIEVYRGAMAAEFTPGMDVAREVVNIGQFGRFTREQLAKLSQYGFFVAPTARKQLFHIYEENEYNNIPNFVTADNLLQLLHVAFNTSLKKTEEKTLLDKLTVFSRRINAELAKREDLADDPAYLQLRRYFLVLHYLLHNNAAAWGTDADRQAVQAEVAKIKAQQLADSAVFETKIDYSLFKVRGHYESTPKLKQYFLAMSWLGIMTFEAKTVDDRRLIALCAEVMSADPEAVKTFNEIYRITGFYVGESDDPNFYDFAAVWRRETGKPPLYADYDDGTAQKVLAKLFAERQARIKTFYEDEARNKSGVIALMGQRYVADSHLFSLLFAKVGVKYLPGGLDLFAALDNQTAYTILKDEKRVPQKFPAYAETLPEGRRIMAGIGEAEGAPLFERWLRLLKIYTNNQENKAPAVFQTGHWRKKKLTTALASWAELKHDTILYSKQTGAECGGGDEPPKVYGYIEPALELYQAMRVMLTGMNQELTALGCSVHSLDRLLKLVDFFILVSDKELRGIPLTDQENEQLRIIGGLLESYTINALGDEYVRWFEITSESARNMAVAADILSFWGEYLHAGVGYADEIFILVPVQGQLYMMRGAVFSYYEFLHGQRLSDSEWYEMVKDLDIKARSSWWQKYLEAQKEKIPAPADPYDSGC